MKLDVARTALGMRTRISYPARLATQASRSLPDYATVQRWLKAVAPAVARALRQLRGAFGDTTTAVRRLFACAAAVVCLVLARFTIRDIAALSGLINHDAPQDALLTQLLPALIFTVIFAYLAAGLWTGKWRFGGPILEKPEGK
jgi:membrane glycosyltransferase